MGRFNPVGAGTAATEVTTQRLVVHVLVLAVCALGAVVSSGLAARSWVQVTRRRRQVARLLGVSSRRDYALAAALVTAPALVLAWPLLGAPPEELVAIQAGSALALALAVVIGARHAPARPTRRHRGRTPRHG